MKQTDALKIIAGIALIGILFYASRAYAEFSDEIRNQIRQLEARHTDHADRAYFHDMGIMAQKADDAELFDLNTEIVRSRLLERLDKHVIKELRAINDSYERDPYQASQRLEKLVRYERYYAPSEEYLSTVDGRTVAGELVQFRKNTKLVLEKACSDVAVRMAIQSVRKTGLFVTNRPEEITSLREISRRLDCCLGWKSRIQHRSEEDFESDYEEGTLVQEADLKLRTSPRNYTEARWEGRWKYRFEGQEGIGEGVSQALLSYRKGEDLAELSISSARLSSSGRINFPMSLAGEKKTIDVEGEAIRPWAHFPGKALVALTGCRDESVEETVSS